MVYALILSYRGDGYSGWQRQNNALTVQQVVEEALSGLLGSEVKIHGASRTDAGVHARGQVAHLNLDHEFPVRGLQHGTNQRLPDDIRVMGAFRMPEEFHARKSAVAKEYRFRLLAAGTLSPLDALFAVRIAPDIDLVAMQRATSSLVGRHDFTAFALAGGGHGQPFRRVLSAEWKRSGEELELQIVGDGFLRGMVRSIVGTLLEVGRSRMTIPEFETLLRGRPREEAGPTAPAHGLVLQKVHYAEEWGLEESFSGADDVLD